MQPNIAILLAGYTMHLSATHCHLKEQTRLLADRQLQLLKDYTSNKPLFLWSRESFNENFSQ